MDKYTFPCNCSFPIVGPPPLPKSNIPAIDVNWDLDEGNVPLDCKATYDLISTGKTKMLFQIEKGAGRQVTKKLRPENIENMGALGAIVRPGCANNKDSEGISTTDHYCKRKNKEEPVASYHPVVDSILEKTYNCLIFQENSTKIAEVIAGFNKQEADQLRKIIGKKLPEEMAKIKNVFIEGAKKVGIVTEKQAEEIFGWIKESQKYSFNRCISPNTLVETESKIKKISDLQIGEIIKTPEGFSEVVNKYDNGIKELYKITLQSGKSIDCTLDHKFLCSDNKKHSLLEILELNLEIYCDE